MRDTTDKVDIGGLDENGNPLPEPAQDDSIEVLRTIGVMFAVLILVTLLFSTFF